jgi:F0F1-type ATP synthase epsilon subunit
LIGGFALVQENKVTILVNDAVRASSVKLDQAEKDLEEATRYINQVVGEKEKVEAVLSFKRARVKYQIVQWKKLDDSHFL